MPESSTARTLAHRLVARDAPGDGPSPAPADAVAACERVYRDLERWIGTAGCHALFTRAFAQVRTAHPALAVIRLRAGAAPGFDHVPDGVAMFGGAAVAAALEDALVALLALLGRMIGEDMTERLLDAAPDTVRRNDPAALPDHVPERGAPRVTPVDASQP